MTESEKLRQIFMAPGDAESFARIGMADGLFGLQVPAPASAPPRLAARAHAAYLDSLQRLARAASRHGIGLLFFDEALHGLMRDGATVFPQAIGLGATFDTALVARVHAAAARETRSRGIRMALSPVVNLATDPRWGRTEETFGEDPWLVAAMGRAHVRAFESAGVVTTPKHFVANVADGGRDSWPAHWSDRALTERFFPPFRSVIQETGARSLMTAYNSVNGDPATQSEYLLSEVLRSRWAFTGFVISDASATSGATVLHRTESSTADAFRHALEAGLDVVFQGGIGDIGPYQSAVASGRIPMSLLDRAAERVLRAKASLGLLDASPINADSAAYWNGHAEHLALAREAAAASVVMLRNQPAGSSNGTARSAVHRILPLSPQLRRIALIGEDADVPRLGGYSGPGIAPVSLREALAARPGISLQYASGPGRSADSLERVPATALRHDGQAGLAAAYWDNPDFIGEPTLERVDSELAFTWTLGGPARALPYDWYAARWRGQIEVPAGRTRRLAIEGSDGVRIWVNDTLFLDHWEKRSSGRWVSARALPPGTHNIRVDYHERRGNVRLALLWDRSEPSAVEQRIAEAVEAARAAEVAVIAVGIEEGEFRDRSRLALPGAQDQLIAAVAATGVPTVVIIVGGSAITMPWLQDVDAVLMAWYPGEQGGPALADLLFGDANPSGRLPISWPDREGQLPFSYDHQPTGRGDDYVDGFGAPLFPFGYGLSYTEFAYDSVRARFENDPAGRDDRLRLSLRVRNVGQRAGHEVVQLYVRDEITSVAQPLIALRGAVRVHLAPGESKRVHFTLSARDLSLLNRDGEWVIEPGRFRLMFGASSRDIRIREIFELGNLTPRRQ